MVHQFILSLFIVVAWTLQASADTIRIGAWNIQDLHHEEGHNLRVFGTFPSVRRRTTDFDLLTAYRDGFGRDGTAADLIALQEIGTEAALDRLFPPDTYQTIMSLRSSSDDAPAGLGDVYTAIAIRKDSGILLLERADLPQLAMMDADGRFTRSGTGAKLQVGDQEFWFLSVHLKSGCPDTLRIQSSSANTCETLWRQALVLRDWITKQRQTGLPVIIAGDFNRQFRRLEGQYALWRAINGVNQDVEVTEPWFVGHPLSATRKCPTRKGSSLEPIDWILVDLSLAEQVVTGSFWETRWSQADVDASQNGRGLSDHCPISLDLELGG